MKETKFKQTDIGLIPEDWVVKELGKIGSFGKGHGISRSESNSGCIPAVRYGELYTIHNYYIKEFGSFISSEIAKNSYRLKKGDLIFTCSGETKEDIGKSATFIDDFEAYAGGDLIVLSPFDEYCPIFLGFVSNSQKSREQKASKGQGDAVVHISTMSIKSLQIPLPPTIEEQERIANALIQVDDLLAALDEQIEKKKLIKQGTMQQLLTGKTRLKGFTGEWKTVKLGKIGNTFNGLTGKVASDFGIGNAQYITFLNVLNNPIIDTSILEKVNMNLGEKQNAVHKGDLFFNTSSETPEEVGICAVILEEIDDLYLNSFCFGFRLFDENVDGEYLAYYFRSKAGRDLMITLAQGATRYNLSKSAFDKSEITIPSTIEEQQAIANILSTMDEEIQTLQEEHDKYALVKQGMMQQLLTGKIRLN